MEEYQNHTNLHVARSWSDTLSVALSFPIRNAGPIVRFCLPRVLPAIAVAVVCLLAIAFMYSGAQSIPKDVQVLDLFFADTTRILVAILGGMLILCCLLYASIEAVSSLGAWYRAYSEHGRIPEDEQAKPFVAGIRRNLIKYVLVNIAFSIVAVAVTIFLINRLIGNSSPDPRFDLRFLAIMNQIVSFGFIAIPIAVYIAVPFTFVIPVMMWEDRGVLDAIRRAFSFTRGYWWWLFGLGVCFEVILYTVGSAIVYIPSLIVGVISTILSGSISDSPASIVISVAISVLAVIVGAVSSYVRTSAILIVYASVREAKEGNQLQHLVDIVGDGLPPSSDK